jgi:hypothetical protein
VLLSGDIKELAELFGAKPSSSKPVTPEAGRKRPGPTVLDSRRLNNVGIVYTCT